MAIRRLLAVVLCAALALPFPGLSQAAAIRAASAVPEAAPPALPLGAGTLGLAGPNLDLSLSPASPAENLVLTAPSAFPVPESALPALPNAQMSVLPSVSPEPGVAALPAGLSPALPFLSPETSLSRQGSAAQVKPETVWEPAPEDRRQEGPLGRVRAVLDRLPALSLAQDGTAYRAGRELEEAVTTSGSGSPGAAAPVPGKSAAEGAGLVEGPAQVRALAPGPGAPPASIQPKPSRALFDFLLLPLKAVRLMLHGDAEVRPFVVKYRARLRAAQILMIVDAGIASLITWGVGRVIDAAVAGSEMPLAHSFLVAGSALIILANVVYAGIERVHTWFNSRLSVELVRDVREHLFRHLVSLPMSFFKRSRSNELTPRVSDDVGHLADKNVHIPVVVPHYLVHLVISAGMLLFIHWGLGLIFLGMLPLFALMSSYFGAKMEALNEKWYDKKAEMSGRAADAFSGMEVIKIFGAEDEAVDYFDRANDELADIGLREGRVESLYITLLSSLGTFTTHVLPILLGAWFLFLIGYPTVGTITSVAGYAWGINFAIEGLSEKWGAYRKAEGATKKILSLLAIPRADDAPGSADIGPIQGEVRFEDVEFRYNEKTPILKGVTFDVRPGQVAAFVGATGSGKTTVLRLIADLFSPQKGRITIDGKDLKSVAKRSLRRQLGIVPQDTALFNGTVRDNLRFVEPGASDERLKEALLAAHAGFVFDPAVCPEGLDTDVGDKGTKLSGGQKQRIAIARAILRNPRLLLLDEATSALDNESERLVQEALSRLMVDRTTFVVAHRLSTIRRADVIFVLKDGRIVESGTYNELVAKRGHFFELRRASRRKPSAKP